MAARVSDLEGLPYWPRMLSRDQAARYVGVSPSQFAKEVEEGRWPAPERRGGAGRRTARLLWDRLLLDRRQDERSGLVQHSSTTGTAAGADEWARWS